jgi:cyclophilin family peptidyl-prolyl cis-trans isomerase/HEAT repeat protein
MPVLKLVGITVLCGTLACAPASPTKIVPPTANPDGDLEVLARVLRAEDRRWVDEDLLEALEDGDPRIRMAAVRALGRIGGSQSLAILPQAAVDPDPGVRATAVFGLGLRRDDSSLEPCVSAAADEDPGVRARAVQCLGMLASPQGSPAVVRALTDAEAGVREEAGLAAWRFADPSPFLDLLVKGTADPHPKVRFACAYALARLGSAPFSPPSSGPVPGRLDDSQLSRARAVLRSLVSDRLPEIRMQAARGLAHPMTPDEESALGFLSRDESRGVRVHAARSLAYEGAPVEPHLLRLVRDRDTTVARAALEGLGIVRTPQASQILLDGIQKENRGWILEAAISSLVDSYASLAPPRLMTLALHKDPRVRAQVASLLSRYDDAEAETRARAFLQDSSAWVRASAFPTVARFEPVDGEAWTSVLEDDDPGVRAAVAASVEIVWRRADAEDESRAALWPVLESAWSRARNDPIPDARLAVLSAASRDPDDPRARKILNSALESADPVTRRRAADVWKTAYGEDRSSVVPPASQSPLEEYRRILSWASKPRAAVVTVQRPGFGPGRFVLRLLTVEAPMTCWNFALLAEEGYYAGLTVHRVVPNFVVQDGDPRGDGLGGPGYAIRDELGPRRFWAGTLGMATDGPDTAGSQWFATLSAQPHLDTRYSAFAMVTQNFEGVLAQILPGDRIVRVEIYEGDGSEPLPPLP